MSFPTVNLIVQVEKTGTIFYFAKWRRRMPDGTTKQIKRRVAPAWLELVDGEPVKRRGRPTGEFLLRDDAFAAAKELMMVEEQNFLAELVASSAAPTVGRVLDEFLEHREHVKGLRPSTLRDYRSMFKAPPIHELRPRPADSIDPLEGNAVLAKVAKTGASNRTVNKYRSVLSAAWSWAKSPTAIGISTNPWAHTDVRREPPKETVDWFTVEEIELVARTLASGAHRELLAEMRATPRKDDVAPRSRNLTEYEDEARGHFDRQDAELVRVAAFAGLRLSEILALRWRDIDFAERKIEVRHTISAGQLVDAPKSGKQRTVTMSDRALKAFDALSRREDFTGPDDWVAVGLTGDRIDGRLLTVRYRAARDFAGLRQLNWHKLRDTFGSQLARGGLDLGNIRVEMGHSKIETTQRYISAKSRQDQAKAITRAQRSDDEIASSRRAARYKLPSSTRPSQPDHPPDPPESRSAPPPGDPRADPVG